MQFQLMLVSADIWYKLFRKQMAYNTCHCNSSINSTLSTETRHQLSFYHKQELPESRSESSVHKIALNVSFSLCRYTRLERLQNSLVELVQLPTSTMSTKKTPQNERVSIRWSLSPASFLSSVYWSFDLLVCCHQYPLFICNQFTYAVFELAGVQSSLGHDGGFQGMAGRLLSLRIPLVILAWETLRNIFYPLL